MEISRARTVSTVSTLPRRRIGKWENLLVSSSSAVQLFILVYRAKQGGMG